MCCGLVFSREVSPSGLGSFCVGKFRFGNSQKVDFLQFHS